MKIKPIILVRYHDKAGINTRLPDSLNKIQGVLPPLNLACLASNLREKGFPVEIIDCQGSNISKEEFERIIKLKKPDFVCIGPFMTPALEGVFEACKICKRNKTRVIVGGPHLSIYPNETLQSKNIDFGFSGEADEVLPQLIDCLINKKDYTKIKGLVWKNKKVFFNDAAIVENLDILPIPAYDLLPMKNYSSIIGYYPTATMMISRGCPYRCGFCYKTPSDAKIRFRNIKLVVKEMKLLVETFSTKEIMFYDDTLTLKRDYIFELCEEIKKSGLKIAWEAPTRVNHVDEKLIKAMSDAGCIRLRMGVESGNEQIRRRMNKGVTNKQIMAAFALCKKYNIETFAYFIIGYMGENEKTMKETIDFAAKLDPDFCMFTVATPLPNTLLFDECVKKGVIDKNYWKNYTLHFTSEDKSKSRGIEKTARLPFIVPDADIWTKKAYKRFYFRPAFIVKKIFKIRTFDTLKKYYRAFVGLRRL
jgi:anaerobic magnesium-protoporphyrin IX monomethyl ester cyclase